MEEKTQSTNFIKNIIEEDLASGKHKSIQTRFPPEPNGHLHIGHAKSICLNFGLGEQYNFTPNLRLDDTNPEKESDEYAQAIMRDIEWLGYKWKLFHASDYFDKLYEFAVDLIKEGKAFVCDLNAEQTREYRGTLKEPGKNSPHRDRSIEENLDLFSRMKAGEFDEGTRVLRAKIDMSHPNINMRDPVIYRIRKVHHQRTGDKWCIYPMYDYTHCLSDALEGITHSLCTLEFEDHRPLYDWFIDNVNVPAKPRQIEFAKLKLDHTVMGKRYLIQMVEEGLVDGWDDPRMPTIAGLRSRGYPPAAIRNFCERIGVGKKETTIDFSILEDCVRQELENTCKRVMGVLDPIKVTITNYPVDKEEYIDCAYHPKDESFGTRKVPMSGEVYIDREDFMENAPRKFFRLSNDKEVRLRYSYVIKCNEIIKDDAGEIIELKCTYDPETMGGTTPDGRKVKGIIHWVSAKHAYSPQVTLYDRLFNDPSPGSGEKDFRDALNKESRNSLKSAKLEESLKDSKVGEAFQFERVGYFTRFENEEFRRTVTLRDTWAKVKK